MKRINSLLLTNQTAGDPKEISDEDIQRSALYIETSTKLKTVERQLQEMRQKLETRKEQWAVARGDADCATKSLEDILAKHRKRWSELTGEVADNGDHPQISDDYIAQAKRIAELEHKLNQALENVRQADTVRDSLEAAISMNEALTMKLEQMKQKHAAEVAGVTKTGTTPPAVAPSETPSKEKLTTPVPALDASKAEKMHKEHRRMRKELDAARASKESARARQEVSVVHITGSLKLTHLHSIVCILRVLCRFSARRKGT